MAAQTVAAGSHLGRRVAPAAAAFDASREFEYTASDFEQIRALIYERAGISLSPAKQDMVYSRLSRRLRACELHRFSDYLELLQSDAADAEWEQFTNSLTTNLTSFFREAHHFPMLRDHIAARKNKSHIRLWSSASSTGEEPYSMAMTMVELFGGFDAPVEIVATDLDTQVLRKASDGVYPVERVEKMDAQRVKKFFLRGSGQQEGFVKVRPELRAMITFQQLNLLDPRWDVEGPFAGIFCRNVLIYFDKETQAKILRRFAPMMEPDAQLYIGHSESLFHVSDVFKLLGKTVYQRVRLRAGA